MLKKSLVIGSYVNKSLSPTIFKYWFNKYKIKGSYFFKQINKKNFNKEIKIILQDPKICGFNVTIPFKETIQNEIIFFDRHSKKIKAINCVSKAKNKWLGKNTDWYGFEQAIYNKFKRKKKKKAVVLGYGGASKAIIYSLKKMNFDEIKIYNRTQEKIKKEKNKDKIFIINKKEIKNSIKETDIVINSTPVDILAPLGIRKLNNVLAFDIVYNPKETAFLSHFSKRNRIYGIDMLIHQAIPCFEDWYGVRPRIDRGIIKLLNKKLQK